MVQKADQLYDEAETARKLVLASQANSLKKSAKEKRTAVKNLDEQLNEKLQELKNI